MKIYFEKGDRVAITSNPILLHAKLKDYFKDEKGRTKIVEDIVHTCGVIYAVSENEGHIQALYQKDNSTHTWKLPVSVFELPTPLLTALHQYGRTDIYREPPK
jgi:hypothetical protein